LLRPREWLLLREYIPWLRATVPGALGQRNARALEPRITAAG